MVQLMLVKPDGALEPLLPTTKFRSEGPPAGRFYFWGIAPTVPGVFCGDEATFRVRIWEGLDWESATLRGESQDITTVVGGGMATPPNLPLERFDLYPRVTLTLPAPVQSPLLQSLQTAPKREVIIQTSTDLLNWERFYSASLFGGTVSFDTFAENQCRSTASRRNNAGKLASRGRVQLKNDSGFHTVGLSQYRFDASVRQQFLAIIQHDAERHSRRCSLELPAIRQLKECARVIQSSIPGRGSARELDDAFINLPITLFSTSWRKRSPCTPLCCCKSVASSHRNLWHRGEASLA